MNHAHKVDACNFPCIYKVEFFAKIEWPTFVEHNGKEYWRTEKFGTNTKTGLPAAEYASDERIWLLSNGSVVPE